MLKLLQKVIADIKAGREFRDFEVSKDKKTKFFDALILQPNISGVGIDFNRVIAFFRGKSGSMRDMPPPFPLRSPRPSLGTRRKVNSRVDGVRSTCPSSPST